MRAFFSSTLFEGKTVNVKLLIYGAQSQIGRAFSSLLIDKAVDYDVLEKDDGLVFQPRELAQKLQQEEFTILLNLDHIDGLKTEGHGQKELEKIHLLAPQNLASAAEMAKVPYLQLSDYQVFSGRSDTPYQEDNEPHAQTLYGATRWQGELAVQRSTSRYIILRVGAIFCELGENCLTDLLVQWEKEEGLQQSIHEQFSPTPTVDVARVIYGIVQQVDCNAEVWGVYHYCSADVASPYDFAEVLLAVINQHDPRWESVKITALEKPTEEINTVFKCEKLLNAFGIRQRPWRGELTRVIELIQKLEKASDL